MFQVGLNPYGMMVTVGMQGAGTPRGASNPIGFEGYLKFADEVGAKCIEFDFRHLEQQSVERLAHLKAEYQARGIPLIVSSGPPADHMPKAIDFAEAIGAGLVRMSMTNVLCGDRAIHGSKWLDMIERSRAALTQYAPIAKERGIDFAVENHQDVGSEELLTYTKEAGTNVGICFDTGNPLAVGEDILDFGKRVAHRVRHLHLKDYRVQLTDEGYRLVRCAIGDGCVPFSEVGELLRRHHSSLTASMEPGALDSRHVRLFTASWWDGYDPHDAAELGQAIATARRNRIPDEADWRTPWERDRPGDEIVQFEMAMMKRSFENVKELGWIS